MQTAQPAAVPNRPEPDVAVSEDTTTNTTLTLGVAINDALYDIRGE